MMPVIWRLPAVCQYVRHPCTFPNGKLATRVAGFDNPEITGKIRGEEDRIRHA